MGRTLKELLLSLVNPDRTRDGALKDTFKVKTGRNLGECAKQEVLNQGNPNCKHPRVFYIDIPFDGQVWGCDDCPRQERIAYSPGFKIRFPAGALISTPNQEYGGRAFYTFRANEKGEVEKYLSRAEWVRRGKTSLETEIIQ
ncbi:MAG: hypothetical protein AABX79_01795 [Nanoarchaeota archaeon]